MQPVLKKREALRLRRFASYAGLLLAISGVAPAQVRSQPQYASAVEMLPDAPQPARFSPIQDAHNNPGATSPARPKLSKSVAPGETPPPLTVGEKMRLPLIEQVQPYAFFTQVLSAGWEHLLDSDPQYGTDSAGFGERLGAAALRQSSSVFFSDGVFASLFRQDPRYYRKGSGPILRRGLYAASRVWVTRNDSGARAPNYSLFAGRAVATALTVTYYPAVSATAGRTARGYAISFAPSMLGNQYHEFWPDISRLLFHRHSNTSSAPLSK